jgi:hypothetical protein
MEKLDSFVRARPSFAAHPSVGTVSMGCAPALRLVEMKASADPPGVPPDSGTLSKYQSLPRLEASSCQL